MKKKTTGQRIAAEWLATLRYAAKRPNETTTMEKNLAIDIDAAVKAERERCVGVVEKVKSGNTTTPFAAFVCDDIIKRMKGGE